MAAATSLRRVGVSLAVLSNISLLSASGTRWSASSRSCSCVMRPSGEKLGSRGQGDGARGGGGDDASREHTPARSNGA